jgi:transaldolase
VKVIEDEGVDKFEKSWQQLLDTVAAELDRAKA